MKITFCLMIAACVALVGCQPSEEKKADKAVEKAVEKAATNAPAAK